VVTGGNSGSAGFAKPFVARKKARAVNDRLAEARTTLDEKPVKTTETA